MPACDAERSDDDDDLPRFGNDPRSSPARGDAIVELAIVDSAGRALIDTLVDTGRPIPRLASEIHGITDSMVRGRPTLDEVMPAVIEALAVEDGVIYNPGFDAPFRPADSGNRGA